MRGRNLPLKATALGISEGVALRGKVALITGASSGLGRECARVLALRGARVLLAVRNVEKGRAAIESFGEGVDCEAVACDLTSMSSVRALAESVARVDRVMLNGGVFGVPFERTVDGFERTFAANYLGHFLLVHRLLARGALAPDARVIATLSEGAYFNPFAKADLDQLAKPDSNTFSSGTASPSTKVLLSLMSIEASRRVRGTPNERVTFNGVLPSATLTDNVNQGPKIARVLGRALGPLIFKPVEEGAIPLVWAATSETIAGVTGKTYNAKLRETKPPRKCIDPEMAQRAWQTSERILGL